MSMMAQVKQLQEYKDLEMLGFYDITGPIQKKRDVLRLAHPSLPRFREGKNYEQELPGSYVINPNGATRIHSGIGHFNSSKPRDLNDKLGPIKALGDWPAKFVFVARHFIKDILKRKADMPENQALRELVSKPNVWMMLQDIMEQKPNLFKLILKDIPKEGQEYIMNNRENGFADIIAQHISAAPAKYAMEFRRLDPRNLKDLIDKVDPSVRDTFIRDLGLTSDLHNLMGR